MSLFCTQIKNIFDGKLIENTSNSSTMRYFIFSCFLFLFSFAILEMGCNNSASEQASTEAEAEDTLCAADFVTVPDSIAQSDSAQYAAFIDTLKTPPGYKISNAKVTHFVIPVSNIDTLIKWKDEGKILPNVDGDDSTWVMLALETDPKTRIQTITPYFACFSSLGNGKKGPVVYYSLLNPSKVLAIKANTAQANMLAMQKYIDAMPKGTLFYPYGFQLPWSDLVGLSCSLQGDQPNNNLNGVLVIKDNNEVDYYLHSFYARKFTKLSKRRPDDGDGEYFDFTSPCPNSCIP